MNVVLPHSPYLLISPTAGEHLHRCALAGFPIITGTAQEISEELISLKLTTLDHPIAVGDISPSVAGYDIEARLLKVLESLLPDVLFFSTVDAFSMTFLSRFAQVVKQVPILKSVSDSSRLFKAFMREHPPEMTLEEGVKKVIEIAPSCFEFYINFRNSKVPAKAKLVELL